MRQLSNLTAILHSKRANIFYLEYARVMQKDGRVLYLKETLDSNLYYNIPIANTTVIFLGKGTSITHAAMRMLSQARVIVGFTGTGGTPLLMGSDIEWITPQSEYRPTKYVQNWLSFWFDESIRLEVAKEMQLIRISLIEDIYDKEKFFSLDISVIEITLEKTKINIIAAESIEQLLSIEGNLTKKLYSFIASNLEIKSFKRDYSKEDLFNQFLNHGNYLAYGIASVTIWVLGIPPAFAVMHGKTRRGALVFDIADLIKDSIILPTALICAKNNFSESEFRNKVLELFINHNSLTFLFNTTEELSVKYKK